MNGEWRIAPIVCYLWIRKLISNHFQTSEPPEIGWASGLRNAQGICPVVI